MTRFDLRRFKEEFDKVRSDLYKLTHDNRGKPPIDGDTDLRLERRREIGDWALENVAIMGPGVVVDQAPFQMYRYYPRHARHMTRHLHRQLESITKQGVQPHPSVALHFLMIIHEDGVRGLTPSYWRRRASNMLNGEILKENKIENQTPKT